MSGITAPKGTRDLYGPEILIWQELEEKVRTFFRRYCFSEIRTPLFESLDLFARGIGGETDVVQKEVDTFTDKGGRLMTLRPENTASVVRAAIEHNLFNTFAPLRFFYMGPMFRYDRPQKGRYRQFHQMGVEVFGENAPGVDAEVIASAWGFLEELGIRHCVLELNSVGCRDCRPGYLKALSAAALTHQEALCPDCQRKATTNPLRIFDCKVAGCRAVLPQLPLITDHLCAGCREHDQAVRSELDLLGVPYTANPHLVRGLDYYTRTAFEITSGHLGSQNALLGGGRYAHLSADLGGPDVGGIGFAAGLERIVLHLEACTPRQEPVLAVLAMSREQLPAAVLLARDLRKQGFSVALEHEPKALGRQLKKADRLGATWALILGEDEVRSAEVTVKHLKAFTQTRVPQETLPGWLKEQQ